MSKHDSTAAVPRVKGRHRGPLSGVTLMEETLLAADAREGSLPPSVGLGRHGVDRFEEQCNRLMRSILMAEVVA